MDTMPGKYDIHPDFAKIPSITFRFSAPIMWLINALMKMQRRFARRRFALDIKNHTLASTDGSRFDVIVMTPRDLHQPAPALLYYHGGAFAMSYASMHLDSCERYANDAGCVVVFVDYRLGPKYPFPNGFDDCYDALAWVVREAGNLGIDTSRIAVGGDSAGGALAAGVAQKARDEQLATLCGQLLIYPVMDNTCSTPSATEFVDVPLWNAISNRRMWAMYLSRYGQGELPPYAAPGLGQLQHLPLSYVETAEFDPLRDEGRNYIDALRAQGVEVVTNETRRTIHGYDGVAGNPIAQESLQKRIRFLQQAFAPRAAG
jgi:acetyl esterase/lipase